MVKNDDLELELELALAEEEERKRSDQQKIEIPKSTLMQRMEERGQRANANIERAAVRATKQSAALNPEGNPIKDFGYNADALAGALFQNAGEAAGATVDMGMTGIGKGLGAIGRMMSRIPVAKTAGDVAAGAAGAAVNTAAKVPGVVPAARAAGDFAGDLALGYEQLKKDDPDYIANVDAVGNLSGIWGTFGATGLAKKGAAALAKQAGPGLVKSAAAGLSKTRSLLPPMSIKPKIKLTPEQVAANASAERAGIPLSIAQETANTANNTPQGILGAIDRASGSLPGGRVVKERHQAAVEKAVRENLNGLSEKGLGPEAVAAAGDAVKTGIEKRVGKYDEQMNMLYGQVDQAGKSAEMTGTAELSDRIINQLDSEGFSLYGIEHTEAGPTWRARDVQKVPTGLDPRIARDVQGFIDRISNIGQLDNNTYSVFRNLKQEVGNKAFEYYGKLDNAIAKKGEYALGIVYRDMADAERRHIAKVAGEAAAKQYDELNAIFAENVAARKLAKAITGYGSELGEHGAKTSGETLQGIIDSKRIALVPKLMPFLDAPTAQAVRSGVLTQFLTKGLESNGQTYSLAKLGQELKKYLVDADKSAAFRSILGDETISKLDDVISGAHRAGFPVVKFADASNPSGTGANIANLASVTGAAAGIATMFGGHAASGGSILLGTLGANYLSNLAQRLLTKQGLSKAEHAAIRMGIGAAIGAGAFGATGNDPATGAMFGAGGGLVAPVASRAGIKALGKLRRPGTGPDGMPPGGSGAPRPPVGPAPAGGTDLLDRLPGPINTEGLPKPVRGASMDGAIYSPSKGPVKPVGISDRTDGPIVENVLPDVAQPEMKTLADRLRMTPEEWARHERSASRSGASDYDGRMAEIDQQLSDIDLKERFYDDMRNMVAPGAPGSAAWRTITGKNTKPLDPAVQGKLDAIADRLSAFIQGGNWEEIRHDLPIIRHITGEDRPGPETVIHGDDLRQFLSDMSNKKNIANEKLEIRKKKALLDREFYQVMGAQDFAPRIPFAGMIDTKSDVNDLENRILDAYRRGAPQDEIDHLETQYARMADGDLSEDYVAGKPSDMNHDEGYRAMSPEEDLIQAYVQTMNAPRGEMIERLRGVVNEYTGDASKYSDDEILAAAADSYEAHAARVAQKREMSGKGMRIRQDMNGSAGGLPPFTTTPLHAAALGGVAGAVIGPALDPDATDEQRRNYMMTGMMVGGMANIKGLAQYARRIGFKGGIPHAGMVVLKRDAAGDIEYGNVLPAVVAHQSKDLQKTLRDIANDPNRINPTARKIATEYFDGRMSLDEAERQFLDAQNPVVRDRAERAGRDAREKKMLLEGKTGSGESTKTWTTYKPETQSVARAGNEKTRGGVYTFDTSRGCVGGSCIACYAGACGNQGKKIHFDTQPVMLRGDLIEQIQKDPKAAFRIGETGEPASDPAAYQKIREDFTRRVREAQESGEYLPVRTVDEYLEKAGVYNWGHTVEQMRAVNAQAPEAAKHLFVITKLPTLRGFDPSVIRNLHVSIDPSLPTHAFRALRNIAELKRMDPTINIVLRTKSVPSVLDEMNAVQTIVARFAKEYDLDILDTPTRVRSAEDLWAIGADAEFGRRRKEAVDDMGNIRLNKKGLPMINPDGTPKIVYDNQLTNAKYAAQDEKTIREQSSFRPFAKAAGIDEKKFLVCNRFNKGLGACAACRNCFKTVQNGKAYKPDKVMAADSKTRKAK